MRQRLGLWLTIRSVLMVVAGVGFGIAVICARVLPWWIGAALIAGMVLMAASVLPGEMLSPFQNRRRA